MFIPLWGLSIALMTSGDKLSDLILFDKSQMIPWLCISSKYRGFLDFHYNKHKSEKLQKPRNVGIFLLLLSSLLYLLYRLISFYTVCRFGFRRILFDMICGSKNCRHLNLYFLSFVTYSQRGCPMWTFVP